MKAQASLEMVVGLIILLVVAAVVIGLVLHYITPTSMPNPSEQIEKRKFLENCETYCQSDLIEYCRYYYPGDDWDKDGIKHELIEVGQYKWPTCEDRVYCFLVSPCDKVGSGLNAIKRCRELLCGTYLEKYSGDVTLANESLWDDINFPNVCDLSSIEGTPDDWYQIVFKSIGCG